MKKQLMISLIAIAAITFGFKTLQTADDGMARVHKIQGKYVFVMCEPVKDYTFQESKSSSFRKAMLGNRDIDDQMNVLIEKGREMVKDGKMEDFDAVLSKDGINSSYIKFKE